MATNAANQVVLYQYGQRFYQRSIGRWIQQDNLEHLGDPTQGNRYTYAGDDPINRIDPSGQWSWEAFGIGLVSSFLAGVVCGGLVVGLGITTVVGGFVAGAICSTITGAVIAGATA